ncbi:MAG TPA: ChaN family lipoprotein [Flavisolibacter sp.]|nr:ChaN family lipoprotein [Flavisolibacter sp.]
MTKYLLLSVFTLVVALASAQDKPAYELFNVKGNKTKYEKLLKEAQKADIVLFGEFHNNPISHWLQLELTKDLNKRRKLILGAEMFEQDNQSALDLYLTGAITQKGFDTMARLWSNYKTDYAPLVNFAKEKKLPFVATNVPRRYASLVARNGFEVLNGLTENEKQWIAPLPIAYDSTLPGYKNMLTMMHGHGGANFPKAQAVKDATMAHFILKNYQTGALFIHYNGAYHSDNYEGILWYLKKDRPDLKYLTISTVTQKDLNKLLPEHKGKADFIISVDDDMTTTF